MGKKLQQLLDDLKFHEMILEIEREGIICHCVENRLWKRLWACSKGDKN